MRQRMKDERGGAGGGRYLALFMLAIVVVAFAGCGDHDEARAVAQVVASSAPKKKKKGLKKLLSKASKVVKSVGKVAKPLAIAAVGVVTGIPIGAAMAKAAEARQPAPEPTYEEAAAYNPSYQVINPPQAATEAAREPGIYKIPVLGALLKALFGGG